MYNNVEGIGSETLYPNNSAACLTLILLIGFKVTVFSLELIILKNINRVILLLDFQMENMCYLRSL